MSKKKERVLGRAIAGLQRLADDFAERRDQLSAEAGLTPGQWRVLEEISTEDFMPSLFARRRAQSPAAVSKTLRQLAEAGLVTVSIDEVDARQRRYALTAKGRRVLGGLRRSRERAIAAVWGDIPLRDLERFADFSESLGRRLEAYADAR
ncbi:MAG: MarR family transcriptional regulator [Deltaproteobacteria bacterium]|nr:MarR family transcriptional regulator [Deltaproteobacteria bacterium]MBW2414133.1 MarR family transcriptional regulator [Deltaproteobacteria bacterium]